MVSRSRSRSVPWVWASAARSGPASSGLSECRPRPIRQTRPPRCADQGAVLALGVAGHDGGEPERDQPGHQPLDDGRLADARLALHPHAGVGHQALAQPLRGVQTDRLGGVHVPADRHPGRDGAGGDREREQPAHLRGGGLPDGAALDVGRPAAVGDRPAPGPRHRAAPVHRTRVRRIRPGHAGGGARMPGSARRVRPRRARGARPRPPTLGGACRATAGQRVRPVVLGCGGAGHRRPRRASSTGLIPKPSAAANPAAWAPRRRRSRSLDCPARCSTSAAAAPSRASSAVSAAMVVVT